MSVLLYGGGRNAILIKNNNWEKTMKYLSTTKLAVIGALAIVVNANASTSGPTQTCIATFDKCATVAAQCGRDRSEDCRTGCMKSCAEAMTVCARTGTRHFKLAMLKVEQCLRIKLKK